MIHLHPLQELWRRSPPARLDALPPAGALDAEELIGSGAHGVVLGILLLRNGHWQAAHELAQAAEDEADADALHALLHRMEGDLGNAQYWHARAGGHPSHGDAALLAAARTRSGLVIQDRYVPAALSRALREASDLQGLLTVHRLELDALFAHCLGRS